MFEIKDSPKLKTSEIFQKLKEKVNVWSYWDDTELDKNFPPPKKETTRYFEKTVEPQNLDPKNSSEPLPLELPKDLTEAIRIVKEAGFQVSKIY